MIEDDLSSICEIKPEKIRFAQRKIFKDRYFPDQTNIVIKSVSLIQIEKSLQDQIIIYRRRKIKNYVYYQCRQCASKFVYKANKSEEFQLLRYNNHHQHKDKKKQQERQFEAVYNHNSCIHSPRQIKNLILSTLGITNRRYNYLLNKLYSQESFKQIIEDLSQEGWEVVIKYESEQQQFPELFLGMSPIMMGWANNFSDSIAFDVTYNLLTHQSRSGRQLGVFFFSGFDSNLRILPLAFGFIAKQTTENFEKIFSSFFTILNWSKITIISDQQQAIKSALVNLKEKGHFRGEHLFDSFHILRNLDRKVRNEEDYNLFYKMITTKSKNIFEKSYNILKRSQTVNSDLFSNMMENIKSFSFSQAKACFIGLSCTSSRVQKTNDIIKKYAPYQINFKRFFVAIKKLIENRQAGRKVQMERTKYELLLKDEGVGVVRSLTEKKIFDAFLGHYMMACRLNSKQVSQDQINGYQIDNDECSCENTVKEGIPCQHLIKHLWEKESTNYIQFFNSRWLTLPRRETDKRGRPNCSRRNK